MCIRDRYYVVLLAMTGGQGTTGDYQSVTESASLETLMAFPQNLAGCYQDFWQAASTALPQTVT